MKSLLLFLVFSYWLLVIGGANAQTAPEFLISWRALNFVPADYPGKIFPSKNSQLEIGFDLLENGKVADLSKNTVNWFLGDQLIQSAAGLKTARFRSGDSDQTVKINILNYKGAALNHLVILPVNKPEVIIDARIPRSEIKLGKYNFEARPFFFNVLNADNLLFKWINNNQPIAGNPRIINLDLKSGGVPSETKMNISVNVANAFNKLEFGNRQINLTIK